MKAQLNQLNDCESTEVPALEGDEKEKETVEVCIENLWNLELGNSYTSFADSGWHLNFLNR